MKVTEWRTRTAITDSEHGSKEWSTGWGRNGSESKSDTINGPGAYEYGGGNGAGGTCQETRTSYGDGRNGISTAG